MTTTLHPSRRWTGPIPPARPVQVALYARVSSERQVVASPIGSQLAALRERASADQVVIEPDHEFIDDGYSGATLVRPALERLRDLAAGGELERLYVHSPDRLARKYACRKYACRKYAYQVLLVDELHRAGVEVVLLNRALGQTPEDDLLLQVQGMVAEYERAKILERSRRGKRFAARNGTVSVLCGAPYGYRYVSKLEGAGQARYELYLEEARVVRQVFAWVARERVSVGEVCRRLSRAGIRTRSGKTTWDRTTIWGMLKNPVYRGAAAFGKTRRGVSAPVARAAPRRAPASCSERRASPSAPSRGYGRAAIQAATGATPSYRVTTSISPGGSISATACSNRSFGTSCRCGALRFASKRARTRDSPTSR